MTIQKQIGDILRTVVNPVVIGSCVIMAACVRQLVIFFDAGFEHQVMTVVFFLAALSGLAFFCLATLIEEIEYIREHPRTIRKKIPATKTVRHHSYRRSISH